MSIRADSCRLSAVYPPADEMRLIIISGETYEIHARVPLQVGNVLAKFVGQRVAVSTDEHGQVNVVMCWPLDRS